MPPKTLYPDHWTQKINPECLHQRLDDRDTRSVQASPEACKVYSLTCINCELLLQAVEHVKPGWMEAMEAREHKCGMITILLDTFGDGAPMIQLSDIDLRDVLNTTRRLYHGNLLIGSDVDSAIVEPMYEAADGDGEWSSLQWLRHRSQALQIIAGSSSQKVFDRASKWLAHCCEHDEACESPNPDGFHPRRLIDVGSWDGSRDPFLVEPDQVSPYACLSYCWGQDGDHVLKTTTANLESHLESIPVDKLRLALHDAITVCRGLKIPYLWIDSLCIIQDDPRAWAEDTSQMDRIYLYSGLIIAALEPATCKSHFLEPQQFGRQDWQTSLAAKLSTPQVFSELSSRGEEIDIFVRNGVEPPLDGGDIVPYNSALPGKFSEDHSLDRRA